MLRCRNSKGKWLLKGLGTPLERVSMQPTIRLGPMTCGQQFSSGKLCYNVATLLHQGTAMAITKLSSRDFNQDTSRAKRAAKRGPVFITDRGRPSHVLLTVQEYERITGGQKSVADLLAMPSAAEVEFEPPRLRGSLHESADLT